MANAHKLATRHWAKYNKIRC